MITSSRLALSVFFFFYLPGPPRALHSFPTRRSSDFRTRHAPAASEGRDPPLEKAERPVRADRKSTRLNSSHVEISYAVFCLKKKKRRRSREELYIRGQGAGDRGHRVQRYHA